jgi:hypothetical protein
MNEYFCESPTEFIEKLYEVRKTDYIKHINITNEDYIFHFRQIKNQFTKSLRISFKNFNYVEDLMKSTFGNTGGARKIEILINLNEDKFLEFKNNLIRTYKLKEFL